MTIEKDEKHLILIAIGQRLKSFRLEKEMTQIDFAVKMGVDYKNMSKIEKGKIGITEIMLYNLCKKFADFDANYILTGEKSELKNGSY